MHSCFAACSGIGRSRLASDVGLPHTSPPGHTKTTGYVSTGQQAQSDGSVPMRSWTSCIETNSPLSSIVPTCRTMPSSFQGKHGGGLGAELLHLKHLAMEMRRVCGFCESTF